MVSDCRSAPDFVQIRVTTPSAAGTARLVPPLQRAPSEEVPEAEIPVRHLAQGPPVEAPVALCVAGQALHRLLVLGARIRAVLAEMPAVTVARPSLEPGAPTSAS